MKKASGAAATRFVYDEAGRLWGEYADDGTLIQETVWLGDLPVATPRPNGAGVDIFYVHADQLGTPRAVTRSSDNQLVWRWDNTEAFGASAPDEDPSGVGSFAYDLRFPGQYFDTETGKHYNYYRDYDPSIGRYVESDPIGLVGGNNTYSYVGGSPLSKSDELGLLDPGSGGGGDGPPYPGGCRLLRQTPMGVAPGFIFGLPPRPTFLCAYECRDPCTGQTWYINQLITRWNPPWRCPKSPRSS